ncbi:LysR family transcriptional regulator [Allokutzneria oryzae]|uniref:LysR substrate-binding domain-containing protein n=1 Tax=Allokutzneria oryzae TaxID=1378989 RepID=A0ABV6A4E1_9PSEU
MLDVRRLRVLLAVVSTGSVSSAAANLGYTPSAISQQITALEREAGLSLLQKAGRGVRPTAAGRLLAEHAAVITNKLAEAETALADLRAGRTGRMRVTYFTTAGAVLVPPAVAEFRQEFPATALDLTVTDPEDPMQEVRAGRADLAITVQLGDTDPSVPGLRFEHLLDDPYRAVLPRGHVLAKHRVLDLAQLADQPWVDNEPLPGQCREVVLESCRSAGFQPDFAVQAGEYISAQGFVAAGLGVTLIPAMGLGAVNPNVLVRRLRNPEPVRRIYAATTEADAENPATLGLLRALRAAAVAAAR